MSSGAGAQQRIAQAQQGAAQEALERQEQIRRQAIGAARITGEESSLLAQQQQVFGQTQQEAASQGGLTSELQQQATALLQGREAAALSPLRRAQERQFRSLRSQLRQRLGSGFETSSSGIEALTRLQESQLGQQVGVQQQALGQLLGAQAQSRSLGLQALGQGGNLLGSSLQARGGIRNRLVGATSIMPDFGNVIQTAGAENVGAAVRAGEQQQLFSSLLGVAGQVGGAAIGGAF